MTFPRRAADQSQNGAADRVRKVWPSDHDAGQFVVDDQPCAGFCAKFRANLGVSRRCCGMFSPR